MYPLSAALGRSGSGLDGRVPFNVPRGPRFFTVCRLRPFEIETIRERGDLRKLALLSFASERLIEAGNARHYPGLGMGMSLSRMNCPEFAP
jgi:hypothetical protein